MWALHENKSLLEGQFAIVLQQISINCCPYSYSGKCQLSERGVSLVTALHCLCVTDWWHPGDMCSHIFKCHHPGDERVRDYKYHIWSHGANIFNTFSPCLVFSLQWLTEERLAWAEVSQTHSELSARRGGTQTIKPDLDTDRRAD